MPHARVTTRIPALFIATAVSIVALVALPACVVAAGITVTSTADALNTDGDCTLREAVIAANGDVAVDACASGNGADVVTIPSGVYTLAIPGTAENAALTGDLDLSDDTEISGGGVAATVIDGGGLDRVFHVGPGITASFHDLTIRGGETDAGDPDIHGGGILSEAGNVAIARTAIVSNTSQYGGGGVAGIDGSLAIEDSTLAGNECNIGTGVGGCAVLMQGFTAADVTMVIEGSTLSGNVNHFGYGVALLVESWGDGDTVATILNSTISQNVGGTLFPGNTSGGIYVTDAAGGSTGRAVATLNNVTVAENTNIGVHAFANVTADALVTVTNSIIAANPPFDCEGNVHSNGYNLRGDAEAPYQLEGRDCAFASVGDAIVADPLLGPLADNGGATATHSLDPGSPALGGGNPSTPGSGGTTCEPSDQRGFVRFRCDIGAYEEAVLTTCPLSPRLDCREATTATLQLRDADADGASARDKLTWKWSDEPVTVVDDFGDPTTSSDYVLCLYGGAAGLLIAGAELPAAATCGASACWRESGQKGFKFKDAAAAYGGVKSLALKADSSAGRARVTVRGKGAALNFVGLPFPDPVLVQLNRVDSAICWQTTHALGSFQTNEASSFKSRIP